MAYSIEYHEASLAEALDRVKIGSFLRITFRARGLHQLQNLRVLIENGSLRSKKRDYLRFFNVQEANHWGNVSRVFVFQVGPSWNCDEMDWFKLHVGMIIEKIEYGASI